MLYVPEYFGHGYLVIDDSIVSYKASEVFFGEGDSGIMYDDPDIGIQWPFELIGGKEKLIISEKDLALMSTRQYLSKMSGVCNCRSIVLPTNMQGKLNGKEYCGRLIFRDIINDDYETG